MFGVLEDAISFDDNNLIVSEASAEASSDDKDVMPTTSTRNMGFMSRSKGYRFGFVTALDRI
jgi:hypothetical protein